MIKVSPDAVNFLSGIVAEQDLEQLHLKIVVQHPGTAMADCHLAFCELDEVSVGYSHQEFPTFNLYLSDDDAPYFVGATIEYQKQDGGEAQLNIKAPLLKGKEPEQDASLFERVSYFIDNKINPMLASHGGKASLTAIEDDKAYIRFAGGCQGCGMAKQTLSNGLQTQIADAFPEINHVLDATDHSEGTNPYY